MNKFLLGVVVVLAAIICVFVVTNMGDKPEDAIETDYSSDFIPEKTILTGEMIAECIQDASELVCVKYSYINDETIEDYKEVFDIKVPFTTETLKFLYKGKIKGGIDLQRIKYYIDNDNKTVTMLLPKPKVISHELDTGSFEFFDVKKSVFTEITPEKFMYDLDLLKTDAEVKFKTDEDYRDQIYENAETVLGDLISISGIADGYELNIVSELPEDFDVPESTVSFYDDEDDEEEETEEGTGEEEETEEETEKVTTEE